MNRITRMLLAVTLCAALVTGLAACSQQSGSVRFDPSPSGLRIGVVPTEDSLPLWVADGEGRLASSGVTLVSFKTAAERDAAFRAGTIDGFAGDLVEALVKRSEGESIKVVTIMLGAAPAQGRYGIAVAPTMDVPTIKQIAKIPVGVAGATVQGYVLDSILKGSSVASAAVIRQEIPDVPTRYAQLMSGVLPAALLPDPYLSLAGSQGAKILADDTTRSVSVVPKACSDCTKTVAGDWASGGNISQTVLVFGEEYLKDPKAVAALSVFFAEWDAAATAINSSPDTYRALLYSKLALPGTSATDYRLSTYPTAQPPTTEEVGSVAAWAKAKGLLKAPVSYVDLVWTPPGT